MVAATDPAPRSPFDFAVIGAGVNGLAAARELAQGGASVALLEQFELDHAHGSSHGDSRTYRTYTDPAWLAEWRLARQLWDELASETGSALLEDVGLLCYSDGGGVDVGVDAQLLLELGIPVEKLTSHDVRERFGIILPPSGDVTFDPTSGIVLAEKARRALATSCRSLGVAIYERCRVVELEPGGEGVRLHTEHGAAVQTSVAVVTAGPWARELVRPIGIDLPVRVTRETVAFFELREALAIPVFIDFSTAGSGNGQGLYALPSPASGLKVAAHHAGYVSDPSETGATDDELVERMSHWVRSVFPTAGPEPTRTETCVYTTAPDEDFLLRSQGRVVVASACSGHGFKFAPATAKRVARIAHDVSTSHALASGGTL